MTHRSRKSPRMSGMGLLFLTVGLLPGLAFAAPVPSPTVPITPATGTQVAAEAPPATPPTTGEDVATPTPTATPAETLPAPTPTPGETLPAPTTTPAPVPYAGSTAPLTQPPGATSPTPATPGAAPKPAGFDMGGQSIAPLPPPPAALDPATIRRQPWRGRWWLALHLGIHGPVGGDTPARPTVLGFGAGADFGWRINNVFGLGMGISGQAHNKLRLTVEDAYGTLSKQVFVGQMLYWDALFTRIHLPVKKRFQPYIEVGGGLARLARAEGGKSYGAQMRGSLGFDGWVTGNMTLGLAATYRLVGLNETSRDAGRWVVGHAMGGVFEIAYHW